MSIPLNFTIFLQTAYHATRVGSRNAINEGSPNVEELASASHRVRTTCVTQHGTCANVVLIQEGETHVLFIKKLAFLWMANKQQTDPWCVISSVDGAEHIFIS